MPAIQHAACSFGRQRGSSACCKCTEHPGSATERAKGALEPKRGAWWPQDTALLAPRARQRLLMPPIGGFSNTIFCTDAQTRVT